MPGKPSAGDRVSKDEIDLSAYPSYLGVRASAEAQPSVDTGETMVRGLVHAGLVGLVGVALSALAARQLLFPVNIDTLMGGVTSAAMVLTYARGARVVSRRGLVVLLPMIVVAVVLSYAANSVSRSWFVYDLLSEDLTMPFTRAEFIWSAFTDEGFVHTYWNLVFPFAVSGLAGTVLGLWKVRRRRAA